MTKKINSIASAKIIIIGIAVLLSSMLSVASEWRTVPFQVIYNVGNKTFKAGSAKLTLTEKNGLWNYSLESKPKGLFKLIGKGYVNEKSTLKILRNNGTSQFLTETYSYRQDNQARRSVDASFDWPNSSITFTRRGETKTIDFEVPVLDRLVVTLAIMQSLKEGIKQGEFQVFDNGSIKTIRFIYEGTETLHTKKGSFDSLRVRRETVAGSTRHSIVWFAPQLNFLPIKLEHYKNDNLVVRMTLKDLNEP